MTNYLNQVAEDFVIETHVNAGWSYRKWLAGESEAWAAITVRPSFTNAEGPARYYNVRIPLPPGVFISNPVVIGTPRFNWLGGFVPAQTQEAGYINGYLWAFNEQALLNKDVEIFFLLKGTWK